MSIHCHIIMKQFEWNQEKNKWLKISRGISFEEIVDIVSTKVGFIKIIRNTDNYPNQRVYIVKIKKYIYCCPFVEDNKKIFLKTIFPSSKLTKILVEK